MLPAIPIGSLFISELIGKEVISDTYRNINSSLTNIESFNEESVNKVIEELDINKKIGIVNSLFENIESEHNKTKILALNNLHDISNKIERELDEIHKDLEYTKTIYFAYFRSKPYFQKLKKLRVHSKILDNRLDIVLKITSI